jgi:hypothetical protein
MTLVIAVSISNPKIATVIFDVIPLIYLYNIIEISTVDQELFSL